MAEQNGDIPSTRASLLERVRHGEGPAIAEFIGIYTPLVRRWMEARGATPAEAEESADSFLFSVPGRVAKFDRHGTRHRGKPFRKWFKVVVRNWAVSEYRKRRAELKRGGRRTSNELLLSLLRKLGDPSTGAAAELSDRCAAAYRADYRRVATLVKEQVAPRHWAIFKSSVWWRKRFTNAPTAVELAKEFGTTPANVYVICHRVKELFKQAEWKIFHVGSNDNEGGGPE